MKIQVLQENLSKNLSITSRFTSIKAQLPILANLLLQAKKNRLTISATNLETSVAISIGAKVEEEGEIAVPSKLITDLVSNLNIGVINLEAEKEQLKITSSGFKSSISGMNTSDFPDIPKESGKNFLKLERDSFLQTLSKVLYSVSVDETRPILTGVLVIVGSNGNNITFVSTDGFRLSQRKISLGGSKQDVKEFNVILPKNVLSELSRIIGDKDSLEFSYSQKENQVIFGIDSMIVASRIIDGEFPDFEKIIPKDFTLVINVDKEEFLRAVKLASVFARDSANVVKLKIRKDSVGIFAESKLSGNQETEIDAKIKSEKSESEKDFVIAFNFKFLEDFLGSCEGDNVCLKLSSPNSPALFLDPDDKNYLHIIMPVKI